MDRPTLIFRVLPILSGLLGFMLIPEASQAAIQEAKLLPIVEGFGGQFDQMGYSVSLEGDRALVAAPTTSDGGIFQNGSVYVFAFNVDTNRWEIEDRLLADDGATHDRFGWSVSLSGDRALVGAYLDDENGDASGAAYVFEREESGNWLQVSKLLAGDGEPGDFFGSSVSVSGDRALVGASYDDDLGNSGGSAYVFERDASGNWLQVDKLLPAGGTSFDHFGWSVSIDGDRALVGSRGADDNGSRSGAAYMFQRDASGDWLEVDKLLAGDGAANDDFGSSVSLAGELALVGASYDDDDGTSSGSAYIFEHDASGGWRQVEKLRAGDAAPGDRFGFSVHLSDNLALVGANEDDDNGSRSGATYLFDRDAMGNWVEVEKLLPSDGAAEDNFGFSVGLSGDRALVGAYGDDENGNASGSAYVFERGASGIWPQVDKLLAGDGAALDHFGWSVSLVGERALIGAHLDDDNGNASGSAYVFEQGANGSWVQVKKLLPDDGESGDSFGLSVSMFGDRALVGAFGDNDNGADTGSAYVFEHDASGDWVQVDKLLGSDGTGLDKFGWSVSLNGDRALVGAYGDDDNGSDSGSAYVFERDASGNWLQVEKLLPGDGESGDNFGYSVSLSGDLALVGAFGDDDNGTTSGSVYLFERDGGDWVQVDKILADDGAPNDYFGHAVSLFGDRALVGAYGDDDNVPDSGSVYVFERDASGSWLQASKLLASDADATDSFGFSVTLSGDLALVGASGDDDNGNASGSAYMFMRDASDDWLQLDKLHASDAAADDLFGAAVSLSGRWALVGARQDNDHGTYSGSAYLFDTDGLLRDGFEE